MDFSNITHTAFASAFVLSLVLTFILTKQTKKAGLDWAVAIASLLQTLWLFSVATYDVFIPADLNIIVFTECIHYASWIFALTRLVELRSEHCLPQNYKYGIYLICLITTSLSFMNIFNKILPPAAPLLIWQGLIFSIIGLLCVEQLYRNVSNLRVIKLFCLALSVTFIFDAYLFSQNLVFSYFDSELWQMRAAISMTTSVLMSLGAIILSQPALQSARITLSRPVALYTTSLTIAGSLLVTLAFGGYYVRIYGGSWGNVVYTLILVSGLFSLILVFTSKPVRENLNVFISKHFFSHKYDYRAEWLKLINQLSQPTSHEEISIRAIQIVSNLFKCSGGGLWLKRGKVLVLVRQLNTNIDIAECVEPTCSDFCRYLMKEWVFAPSSESYNLSQKNGLLPPWINDIDDAWLVLPLLSENSLVGFMTLTAPMPAPALNWEDLDLLKTVGRQIASYLERHEQSELLTESRQFDAFNKLSAFVMHDLKNLIAQQSLVVKNAEKHKDNPEFIEDALNTVKNSVARMNNLLRKLQHNEPESIKILALKDVLTEAVDRCHRLVPYPTLQPCSPHLQVSADFDSLVMVFTHIIQNAQDATPEKGAVTVRVDTSDDEAVIIVEDNGSGMDQEFIQNRLFKPFETTKRGKGMGIGVYQAKEYTLLLGGNVTVDSTLGKGTRFIVSLPLAEANVEDHIITEPILPSSKAI